MGKGRKPIPGEIREQMGNPGHRKIAKSDSVSLELRSDVPDFLQDEAAIEAWNKFHPLLKGMSFLKAENYRAIGAYCAAIADWVKAREQLLQQGFTYETESAHMTGKLLRINPLHRVRLDLEKIIIRYEEKLGISPLDRQSLLNHIIGSGAHSDTVRASEEGATSPDMLDLENPMNFAFGSPEKPN